MACSTHFGGFCLLLAVSESIRGA